jgi:hypothetical protein
MMRDMKSAPWPWKLPSVTAVLATASDLTTATAAIDAGADLIDLWAADEETVRQVQKNYPDIPAIARSGQAALTRDPAAAKRTGALVVGENLVEAAPDQAAALIEAGAQVIVRADDLAGPHAAAAVAAIATWLGAVAVSTAHVAAARRAVDMTGSIRGTRPVPAGYVRS